MRRATTLVLRVIASAIAAGVLAPGEATGQGLRPTSDAWTAPRARASSDQVLTAVGAGNQSRSANDGARTHGDEGRASAAFRADRVAAAAPAAVAPAAAEAFATAQPRRGGGPRGGAGGPALRLQVFGEVGWEVFAASNSFQAVLGSSSGASYGGGARLAHRSGLFGQVDVSRFKGDGSRVFVSNGEVFSLDIPTTITLTPVDVTIGLERRMARRPRPGLGPARARGGPARGVSYYAGGGFGTFGYKETAPFATAGDDADDRFRSYHVMGGLHVPVWSMVGVGFDVQRRWVNEAIGSAGVSEAFDETDLGGVTLRLRFTLGL